LIISSADLLSMHEYLPARKNTTDLIETSFSVDME
jgi:hypothetical protein